MASGGIAGWRAPGADPRLREQRHHRTPPSRPPRRPPLLLVAHRRRLAAPPADEAHHRPAHPDGGAGDGEGDRGPPSARDLRRPARGRSTTARPRRARRSRARSCFAGLSGGVPVSVWEPEKSRDHSERMLSALGVGIAGPARRGRGLEGGPRSRRPIRSRRSTWRCPGDPSSAAFLVALALLAERRRAPRPRGGGERDPDGLLPRGGAHGRARRPGGGAGDRRGAGRRPRRRGRRR